MEGNHHNNNKKTKKNIHRPMSLFTGQVTFAQSALFLHLEAVSGASLGTDIQTPDEVL